MAKKNKMSKLDWIAYGLLVVGGLNWGLVSLNFNLVSYLFGTGMIANIVYGAVGLSAVYALVSAIMRKK